MLFTPVNQANIFGYNQYSDMLANAVKVTEYDGIVWYVAPTPKYHNMWVAWAVTNGMCADLGFHVTKQKAIQYCHTTKAINDMVSEWKELAKKNRPA